MSAVTDLWLVRHGHALHHQTEQLQWQEVPLSDVGCAQAERLASRLGDLDGVVKVYSSPLPRAWHTAVPIADALGLDPVPVPDLREIDFGVAGGLRQEEFFQRWPELFLLWRDPDNLEFRWPGGESRGEFHRRVVPAMESLVRAHGGERIVVVSHTGPLCAYLAHLFLGDSLRWRDFPLQPASVTQVEVGPAGAHLLLRDDVTHLQST